MASPQLGAERNADMAYAYNRLVSPEPGHDGDRKRRKVNIRLSRVIRYLVGASALANIILWKCKGLAGIKRSPCLVVLFVELFLVLIWSVALLLPRSWGRFLRALPTLACQCGDAVWVISGDGREHRLHGPVEAPPKQKKSRTIIGLVDLVLGLSILILLPIGWAKAPWYYGARKEPVGGLSVVVSLLELFAASVTFLPWLRNLVFELGVFWCDMDDDSALARIRLPPDTEDRRTAGGTVSVAA